MKRTYCDLCGKETVPSEPYTIRYEHAIPRFKAGMKGQAEALYNHEKRSLEVCHDCMVRFERYIRRRQRESKKD